MTPRRTWLEYRKEEAEKDKEIRGEKSDREKEELDEMMV